MTWRHLLYIFLMGLLGSFGILNIWNSWKFQMNEYELSHLEKLQHATLEQNKRLQASIMSLSAPERILILVEQNPQWQLKRLSSQDITIIEIKEP
ncbi:cell division protein FtsL [Entomospira entomophila]|uniref:Cell division protein FtsL n=1 Tax=Entomospira entomophila TaxID=2719988 RepID=A0A968G7D9_9SPIO|nr:cell division protein FtsL [Entomospira entomophilus]NIZ39972.1 cell division protein FtsL [Entomospira entomophilus]WDI35533.1 cell division protein FtsL [Entomospira entomophilus]